MTATLTATSNPYLDHYREALAHQQAHNSRYLWENQPHDSCFECLKAGQHDLGWHGIKRRYAWAIPNDAALRTIADHAPVVEIGAGGGYWAGLLRARSVDVLAYDIDPDGGPDPDGHPGWHDGRRWSQVLPGDHTAVQQHPDRTLLLIWPSYNEPWTDQVLDLYTGDTVIYVGEGPGGCTGTDRMHDLLGQTGEGDARFAEVAEVDIPQWAGLHDRLTVHQRIRG